MRTVAVLGLLGALSLAPQRASDPSVAIGVWYGGPGVEAPDVARDPWKDVEPWRRDLEAIRDAGFSSITAWTNWAHAEPIEGRYRLDVLEHLLRLAEGAGLQVALEIFAEPAPTWVDGPPCGGDGAVTRMVAAANSRALAHRSFRELVLPAALVPGGCLASLQLSPKPAGRPPLTPAELGLALDRMRAGTGRGFWLSRLQASPRVAGGARGPEVTDADVRLWIWAAFARGARGIALEEWERMTDASGAPTRAAAAAGALAMNFTRNARLFGTLSPRRPRVAILHTGDAPPSLTLYRAAFDRNLAVDLVQPGELLSGAASRYQALLVEGEQAPVVQQALKVFELSGGVIVRDPERVAAAAPPDIRIAGAPGLVEARFLESPDTWLLVAINHADAPQRVTLGFGTDIPEAIWVDMETGNSVTFLQSPSGPTLTHTFPARDVLVLVRSKRLR